MKCKRVEARIECPECGYPASEARYPLDKVLRDPGHAVSLGGCVVADRAGAEIRRLREENERLTKMLDLLGGDD